MRIDFRLVPRVSLLCTGLLCCALMLCSPQEAAAQSHWGVTTSFVPRWNAIPELYEVLFEDIDGFEPDGSEFRIGVTRGSDLGGDWSVTFIRNKITTERVYDETQLQDFGGTVASPVRVGSSYFIPEDPTITGIKYEKFTPFVTIQDRVQIGLTYGGGIGALKGDVRETFFNVEFGAFNPVTRQQTVTQTQTVTQQEVKDLYALEFVPIGSVEAAVAVILAPGLKARVTGGFNFPNTQVFSFTINYLFDY